MKKRSTPVVAYSAPKGWECPRIANSTSMSVSNVFSRSACETPNPGQYPRYVRDHKAKIWDINWSTLMVGQRDTIIPNSGLGKTFSSTAQLNGCGSLQMTGLSSWEEGGRVHQKVFLCLALTSGRPNYHQHSSGLCRSIRRPTPPKTIHIIVKTKGWFLFCLFDDLWVVEQFEYGVEKKS